MKSGIIETNHYHGLSIKLGTPSFSRMLYLNFFIISCFGGHWLKQLGLVEPRAVTIYVYFLSSGNWLLK